MFKMKAVIYARYSSSSQTENSIEGQVRECQAFAERQGMTVLDTYIDRALSAKTDNRPQFQKMIKDSVKGNFEIILVWNADCKPELKILCNFSLFTKHQHKTRLTFVSLAQYHYSRIIAV
jgi:DNA invertase Pin-like site-specific DNA recombinase